MAKLRTAVITGIGPVSALGIGKKAFLENLYKGTTSSRACDLFSVNNCYSKYIADVSDFNPSDFIAVNRIKRFDRFAQLAVASAKIAIDDSSISIPNDTNTWGISFGSAIGGFAGAEKDHQRFIQEGRNAVSLPLPFRILGSSAASQIAMELKIHGMCTSNSDSCAAGNSALGQALNMIQSGTADVVIAGAAEAPLAPLTFSSLDRLKVLSPRGKTTPFSKERDGFVLAEGAASLIIEEKEHAILRGASIYCELSSYSSTNEAYHMTSPDPSAQSVKRSMSIALEKAQLSPESIDLISTHGSATQQNDSNEAKAIHETFGPNLPALIATKASSGHCLGGVSALEAIICASSIAEQKVPPSPQTSPSDTTLKLPISEQTKSATINAALSNAFGFGGIDTCLTMKKL